MALDIEILSGPLKGKRMRLPTGVHTVGRGVGLLPFQDPGLSAEHARLHVFPHRFEVEDLGSTNGTFVNDGAVAKATIAAGDVVRLGPESSFRVMDPAEGKRGAAKGLAADAVTAPGDGALTEDIEGQGLDPTNPQPRGIPPRLAPPRRENGMSRRRRALRWAFVALFAMGAAGMLIALKSYFEEIAP